MLTLINENLFKIEKRVKKFKDGIERQYVRYSSPACELEAKKSKNGVHDVIKPRIFFELFADPDNIELEGPMMFNSFNKTKYAHGPFVTVSKDSTYDKDITLVAFPYNGTIEPVRSNNLVRICHGSVFITNNKSIIGCDMTGSYRNLLVLALDLNTNFIKSLVASHGPGCDVMKFSVKRIVESKDKHLLINDVYTLQGYVTEDTQNAYLKLSGPVTTRKAVETIEPVETSENIWEAFPYPNKVKWEEEKARRAKERSANGSNRKPFNKKPDQKFPSGTGKHDFKKNNKYDHAPRGAKRNNPSFEYAEERKPQGTDASDRNYKRDYGTSASAKSNSYDKRDRKPADKPKKPQQKVMYNKNGIPISNGPLKFN